MKRIFRLQNLDCPVCAAKMERAVSKIEGVNSVDFCFLTQRFTLDAEDDRFDDILSCAVKKCRKIDPDCKIVL